MNKISVIMPAYNLMRYAQLFENSVESILQQTHTNLELIIVDDCSTDKTSNLIQKQMKKDNRIRGISLAKNVGPGIARNIGFKICKGKYVTFQDADDWSEPKRFEKLLANIPDYGIIVSSLLMKYPNKTRERVYNADHFYDDVNTCIPKPRIHFSSALMTRDMYEQMGGMEHYRYSSDSLLAIKIVYFLKMTNKSGCIKSLDDFLFHWNRQISSITMHASTHRQLSADQAQQRKPLVSVLDNIKTKKITLPISEQRAKQILNIKDNIHNDKIEWSEIVI